MAIKTNINIEGVTFNYYEIKNFSGQEYKKVNENGEYEGWIRVNVTVIGFTNKTYSEVWQQAKFKDTRNVTLDLKKSDSIGITFQEIYAKVYQELLKLDEFADSEIIL